jgi:hypothetical protein
MILKRKTLLEEAEKENIETPMSENPSGFQVILREFAKDRLATISFFALVAVLIFIFVFAATINLEDLNTVNITMKYHRPSFTRIWDIFGRDAGGRSIFGLLIVGARNSIYIGFLITLITTVIGVIVGLIMGYYGSIVDSILLAIIDFIGILPTMLIIIALVSLVPKFTAMKFVLILSAFRWTGTARLVRSKALSESRRDYVSASKTMGTRDLKIMLGGVLPNISSIIIVDTTLALAGNIGIETSLSFLGFGLPTSVPSIGTLIAYASKPEIIQDKAFVWLPATIFILFMMLTINYIGQALRRASDAKQRLG